GEVRVALPSIADFALERCEDHEPTEHFFDGRDIVRDDAVLLGRVVSADGASAAGAEVLVRWERWALPVRGAPATDPVRIGERWEERVLTTDERGAFVVCGAPGDRPIRLAATDGPRASDALTAAVPPESGVGSVVLLLPGADAPDAP